MEKPTGKATLQEWVTWAEHIDECYTTTDESQWDIMLKESE